MTRLSKSILIIPIVFVLLFSFSGCSNPNADPLIQEGRGRILSPLRLITNDSGVEDALFVDDSTGVIYVFVVRGSGDRKVAGITALLNSDGTPKLYSEYAKENEITIDEQGDTSNE